MGTAGKCMPILIVFAVVLKHAHTEPHLRGTAPLSSADIKNHPNHRPATIQGRSAFVPPLIFDAAQRWPQCSSIRTIRHQGPCNTCWAVVAASVIADRLCVSDGVDRPQFISASQTAACGHPERSPADNCDQPGNPANAFKRAAVYGVASGGEYGSKSGCVPYNVDPKGRRVAISCAKHCTNEEWSVPLPLDSQANLIDSYWINYGADMSIQSNIDANILQMKEEIFRYGPIAAQIFDSAPPLFYDSRAPYDASQPMKPLSGGHAVRITGWNISREGVPYWIVANSWGPSDGDRGYYWIRMGKNVAGIEEWLSAPIINISSEIKCESSSFCSAPVDQVIQMDITTPNPRSFLLQGECLLEVVSHNGILTAVRKAVPLAKIFVNAPSPPISATKLIRGELWLVNPSGEEAGNCVMPPEGHKYMCEKVAGRSGLKNSVAQARRGNQTIAFTYGGKTSICYGEATAKQLCTYVGSLLAKGGMKDVTGFLNNDDKSNASRKGTEAFIFGKDAVGNSLVGILAYPSSTSKSFMWVREPIPVKAVLQC